MCPSFDGFVDWPNLFDRSSWTSSCWTETLVLQRFWSLNRKRSLKGSRSLWSKAKRICTLVLEINGCRSRYFLTVKTCGSWLTRSGTYSAEDSLVPFCTTISCSMQLRFSLGSRPTPLHVRGRLTQSTWPKQHGWRDGKQKSQTSWNSSVGWMGRGVGWSGRWTEAMPCRRPHCFRQGGNYAVFHRAKTSKLSAKGYVEISRYIYFLHKILQLPSDLMSRI